MKAEQIIEVANADEIDSYDAAQNADLAFMDSPYNIGIDYGEGAPSDRLDEELFISKASDWIRSLANCLRPGGVLAVLISEEYATSFECILQTEIDLVKINRIIWRERFAQYTESKFVNEHRHLFLYRKAGEGERVWNTDSDLVRVPSVRMEMGDKRAKGLRVPGDVWECPRLPGNAKARVDWHPCQLHPGPLKRLVYAYTNEGGRVVESFAGSGSLARVCKEMNRDYFGVDLSPAYVEKARKRLEE